MEQQIYTSHRAKNIALVVTGFFLFGLGVVVGITHKVSTTLFDDEGNIQINKVVGLYNKTHSSEVEFEQYWDVWDKIKQNYVKQPVDDVALFYGSLEGLVAGLGDPYSTYFPPAKAQEFTRDLSGEFEGIGAEIGLRDDQLIIIAPLPGSPAEQAGLHTGDKIMAIDGQDTVDMSVEEAVLKVRGKRGTEVTLAITDNGLETLHDVVIVRDTISVSSVTWEKKQNDIVYLRVGYINDNTWQEFDKAVKDILLESPKGIVLDVRNNPGGYLDTSVRIAAEWIDKGVIVRERFNSGKEDTYGAEEGKHRFVGIPTVVLIDGGTASGAEIIAGALQDYGVATIIGETTFGKGSVQEFEVLSDGSALKLTVAEWLTPKERQINDVGITPDEEMQDMFIQKEGTEGTAPDDYIDNGLARAITILE